MSNPFLGILTPALKSLYSNMMNALLADDGATVPCRLIYPQTKWTICPNCNINPVTGKSSGVYNGTGPSPFTKAPCPVCQGDGKSSIPETDDIYLMVIWDYKKWFPVGFNLQTPEGYVQTISNITTLPKIKRAEKIVFNTNIEGYTRHIFAREGEPNPCGCCVGDDVFIITMWKR